MTGASQSVLAIDLGKTSCRARLTRDGTTIAEVSGAGSPGLADDSSAELAFRAVNATLDSLGGLFTGVAAIGIGAAGAAAAPDAARHLIRHVLTRIDAPVAVLSDALAAHIGAFAGEAGTVLIAGTGAVALSVSPDGVVRQVDGWGPWLGDEGSGRWIGQRGLQAALRAHDSRGSRTLLEADAVALAGTAANLPVWVSTSGEPARRLGSFAPVVIARAEQGDVVAAGIIDEAVQLLAFSCAAGGDDRVCVTGGLATHPYFAARLDDALRAAGLGEVPPIGDPLSGAMIAATEHSLPSEGRIIRG